MQLNAEVFHYDYEGYQVVVIATDPTGFFPGSSSRRRTRRRRSSRAAKIETNFAIGENPGSSIWR